MTAYLVRSSITHTETFYRKFSATVEAVPYDGPAELESEYRRQIRVFLNHIDHNVNYSDLADWRDVYVPIPYKLGTRNLPLVFTRPSRLGFTRALDALEAAGVIERRAHDRRRHVCRTFRIVPELRAYWYQPDRALQAGSLDAYKSLRRGYDPVKTARGQRAETLHERIERAAVRGVTEPEHDLSALDNAPDARERYRRALARLEPNRVNLDTLIDYARRLENIAEYSDPDEAEADIARYRGAVAAIDTILARGITIVNENPLVVEYRPSYRVAAVGGRMFEIGGGFQTLPSRIKFEIFQRDRNYDIASSQLNILRRVLDSYSIETDFFDRVRDLDTIARRLGIARRLAKIVLYGTLFSAGAIRRGPGNSIYRALVRALGDADGDAAFTRWQRVAGDLMRALRELVDTLWSRAELSDGVYRWRNACGTVFEVDSRDLDRPGTRARAERQLLAHIVQGHETEYVLRTIESGNTVVALEHDGLVGEVVRRPDYLGLRYEIKAESYPFDWFERWAPTVRFTSSIWTRGSANQNGNTLDSIDTEIDTASNTTETDTSTTATATIYNNNNNNTTYSKDRNRTRRKNGDRSRRTGRDLSNQVENRNRPGEPALPLMCQSTQPPTATDGGFIRYTPRCLWVIARSKVFGTLQHTHARASRTRDRPRNRARNRSGVAFSVRAA